MTVCVWFWLCVVAWFVVDLWGKGPAIRADWRPAGSSILLFAAMLLLAWQVCGAPVK